MGSRDFGLEGFLERHDVVSESIDETLRGRLHTLEIGGNAANLYYTQVQFLRGRHAGRKRNGVKAAKGVHQQYVTASFLEYPDALGYYLRLKDGEVQQIGVGITKNAARWVKDFVDFVGNRMSILQAEYTPDGPDFKLERVYFPSNEISYFAENREWRYEHQVMAQGTVLSLGQDQSTRYRVKDVSGDLVVVAYEAGDGVQKPGQMAAVKLPLRLGKRLSWHIPAILRTEREWVHTLELFPVIEPGLDAIVQHVQASRVRSKR